MYIATLSAELLAPYDYFIKYKGMNGASAMGAAEALDQPSSTMYVVMKFGDAVVDQWIIHVYSYDSQLALEEAVAEKLGKALQ